MLHMPQIQIPQGDREIEVDDQGLVRPVGLSRSVISNIELKPHALQNTPNETSFSFLGDYALSEGQGYARYV